MLWCYLGVLATMTCLGSSINMTYDDPDILALNCYPTDSCREKSVENASRSVRLLEDFSKRVCKCDDRCSEFGDCCIDAPILSDINHKEKNERLECRVLRHYGGYYMDVKCPDDWQDPDIRAKCESSELQLEMNPLLKMPVSHLESGDTYKNAYCAICNGNHDRSQMALWKTRIACFQSASSENVSLSTIRNISQEFLFHNIHFNETLRYLGVMIESSFVRCDVDPYMPESVEHKVRKCRESVSKCTPEWPDDEVRKKCGHYVGVVNGLSGPSYRNIHCWICNGLPAKDAECTVDRFVINGRNDFLGTFRRAPFTLLFDFNSYQDGDVVGVVSKCASNELFDPFFKKCRNLVCGKEGYVYKDGSCSKESTMLDNEIGRSNVTDTINQDNLTFANSTDQNSSEPFTVCPKWELPRSEVLLLKNGSIYVMEYQRMFNPNQFRFIESDSVLVCAADISKIIVKFSPYLTIVSLIGLSISLVCLIFHFLAFLLVPELQNLSGKNLASLVVALFAGYFAFILGMFSPAKSLSCNVVAIATYYSFLAVFFWMNVISFDIWQTLKMATTELRVSGGRQIKKFVAYSIYSWLTPAILATIAVLLDFDVIPSREDLKPSFGQTTCWFHRRLSLAVFFGGPAGILLLFNLIFFVLSSSIIIWSTRSSSKLSSPTSSSRRSYKLYMRLAVITGLTWIWGFLAGFFNNEVLWYLFVIFNTLIGLFIFMTFTCAKKVRRSLKMKLKCCTERQIPNELFNISASAGSNINSNDTRKSSLIPTDSADSSERHEGYYNPVQSSYRKTTEKPYYH